MGRCMFKANPRYQWVGLCNEHGPLYCLLISQVAQTQLYYAFSASGAIFCAKVFRAESKADFEHEQAVLNQMPPHPNVMQLRHSFLYQGRGILILPFYPRTVYDVVQTCPAGNPLPELARKVLKSGQAALRAIHDAGWCHCDVKPTNILLPAGDTGEPVLGDMGSCVRIGNKVCETSPTYHLDFPFNGQASPELDIVCLAATALEILGVDCSLHKTRVDVERLLVETCRDSELVSTVKSCLDVILNAQLCAKDDDEERRAGHVLGSLAPSR